MKIIRGLAWGMVFALCACTPASPSESPSNTPSPTPSASPTPEDAQLILTTPGAAQKIVEKLLVEVGQAPVLKVDITRTSATITVLDDGQIKSYQWLAGLISEVESDVRDINQSSFDPRDFNLSDVGHMFAIARELGGGSESQELQIVEYNSRQVLMTVSSRPEKTTVFFRPDATPIHELDFTNPNHVAEALKDVLNDEKQVFAIGITPEVGFWADYVGETEGVIVRAIRQPKLPMYRAPRKQTFEGELFPSAQIKSEVIAEQIEQLSESDGFDLAQLDMVVKHSSTLGRPTMLFKIPGHRIETEIDGTIIETESQR